MRRIVDAQQRLIAGAIDLIHARSYGAVSVDDLCAQAGVHKGSFYHFFPSKRDLMLATLEAQWQQAKEQMLEPAFAPDVSPLERIVRFFSLMASHGDEAAGAACILGCPFGNLAVEMGTQDPVIRAKVQEIFAGMRGYIEGALREAAAAGETEGVDPVEAAQALVAYYEGVMVMAKAAADPDVVDRLGHSGLQMLTRLGRLGEPSA